MGAAGIVDFAQPVLDRLAIETGEFIRLAVIDDDRLTWVARAQGARSGLRYDPDVDNTARLSCTASGHAWLMTMSDQEALTLVARQGFGSPQDYGPKAPTDPLEFLKLLHEARRRGYGMTHDMFGPGLASMAVPIRRKASRRSAIVSVAGPSVRLPAERFRGVRAQRARSGGRTGERQRDVAVVRRAQADAQRSGGRMSAAGTPVSIAVVGAGLIGARHVAHVAASPAARLHAVVDPAPAGAALAARHGAPHFRRWRRCSPRAGRTASSSPPPTPPMRRRPADAGRGNPDARREADHRRHRLRRGAAGRRQGVRRAAARRPPSPPQSPRRRGEGDRRTRDARPARRGARLLLDPQARGLLRHALAARGRARGRCSSTSSRHRSAQAFLRRGGRGAGVPVERAPRPPVEETAAILLRFRSGALGTVAISDAVASPWSWEHSASENRDFPRADQVFMQPRRHGGVPRPAPPRGLAARGRERVAPSPPRRADGDFPSRTRSPARSCSSPG